MKREDIARSQWSHECWSFIDHWASLRDKAWMPTSERFLDNPAPRFVPQIYIVDVLADEALIRLQGEETVAQWGANVTGRIMMHTQPPQFRKRSLANLHQIVARPCGMLARISLKTNHDRALTSEVVRLPLAQKAGRPPRVVCFSLRDANRSEFETFTTYYETHAADWIDLGQGVPTDPPLTLSS